MHLNKKLNEIVNEQVEFGLDEIKNQEPRFIGYIISHNFADDSEEQEYIMTKIIYSLLKAGAKPVIGYNDSTMWLVTKYGSEPDEISANIYKDWLVHGGKKNLNNPISNAAGICFAYIHDDFQILNSQPPEYYVDLYLNHIAKYKTISLWQIIDVDKRFNLSTKEAGIVLYDIINALVIMGADIRMHNKSVKEDFGSEQDEIIRNIIVQWKNEEKYPFNKFSDFDGIYFSVG